MARKHAVFSMTERRNGLAICILQVAKYLVIIYLEMFAVFRWKMV